jgi:hypothetical protein
MAGRIVIVHDTRLAGDSPKGDMTLIRVNQKTPLSALVHTLKNVSLWNGGEVRLRILCHGYEDPHGHGGYGLQLCREGLKLGTVNQLQPLNGDLGYYIKIYACAAADVAPGHAKKVGDGRMLCSRIASITGTGVFAADATQYYSNSTLFGLISKPIDFGAWEGNLLEFNAAGTLVGSTQAPSDN